MVNDQKKYSVHLKRDPLKLAADRKQNVLRKETMDPRE